MGIVQNPQIKQFVLGDDEEMFSMSLRALLNSDNDNEYYNYVDYKTLTRFEKRAILQILDEQTRIGKWHRLMPLGDL